jgi:hypothetical protein
MRYRDAYHFALPKLKLLVDQSCAILFKRKHGVISESVFAAPNRHLATNKGDLRAVPVYFSFGNQPINLTFRNATRISPRLYFWRRRVVSMNTRFGVLKRNIERIVPIVRTEESRGRTCDSFFHHFV